MSKEELDLTTQEAAEQLVETGTESPEKSQEVISEIVTESDPSFKIQEYTINFQRQVDEFRLAQGASRTESVRSIESMEPRNIFLGSFIFL